MIYHAPSGQNPLPSSAKRKKVLLVGSVIALILAVTGATWSWFSAKDQRVNKLPFSDFSFEIEEPSWQDPPPVKPGDILPKDPQIVNTGSLDLVARVRIEEVWTLKEGKTDTPPLAVNPDYVKYFASNCADPNQFLPGNLLANLSRFVPRLDLTPNLSNSQDWPLLSPEVEQDVHHGSWYWGKGVPEADGTVTRSPWLYYDKVLKPGQRTDPVFRAVFIRTAEDLGLSGEEAAAYNTRLAKYDLEIRIYGETVQAVPAAWKNAFGSDLPEGWENSWGRAPAQKEGT